MGLPSLNSSISQIPQAYIAKEVLTVRGKPGRAVLPELAAVAAFFIHQLMLYGLIVSYRLSTCLRCLDELSVLQKPLAKISYD
jgi:hypothetical protein